MNRLERARRLTYALKLAQYVKNEQAVTLVQDLFYLFYEGWNKTGDASLEFTDAERRAYEAWLAEHHAPLTDLAPVLCEAPSVGSKPQWIPYVDYLKDGAGSLVLAEVGLS